MNRKIKVKYLHTLTGHNGAVYQLQKYDDNSFLSAGGDGWIVKWDFDNIEIGKLVAKTDTQIFSLCYDAKSNLTVAGDMHGELHFIDLADQSKTRRLTHHKKGVFGIERIGEDLFTLGGSGLLSKWNIENLDKVESIQLSSESLRSIIATENFIYIGSSDHGIYQIERASDTVKQVRKKAHENSVFSLAYHTHKNELLSGGRDAMLNIWKTNTELEIFKGVTAHLFTINDIKFSPNNNLFATASRDKTIKIWDADTYQLLKVIESIRDDGHVNSVNHLLWLSDTILLSCSDDRTIKVWEINY